MEEVVNILVESMEMVEKEVKAVSHKVEQEDVPGIIMQQVNLEEEEVEEDILERRQEMTCMVHVVHGDGGSYNSGTNQNTEGYQANGDGFVEITRLFLNQYNYKVPGIFT